jgi:hypothetical protein
MPGEPLAARYNWRQGPVPGRGPTVEKHWFRLYDVADFLWLQFMEHVMLFPILLLLLLIWWRSCPRSARTKPQLHVFSSNCQLTKLIGILRSPAEYQTITSRKKLGYLLTFLFTRAQQWSPSQNEIRPYIAQYTSASQKDKGHSLYFLYRLWTSRRFLYTVNSSRSCLSPHNVAIWTPLASVATAVSSDMGFHFLSPTVVRGSLQLQCCLGQ